MIDLKQSLAAVAVVLTTAVVPVSASADEANFGILGAIFGKKAEVVKADAAEPKIEAATDEAEPAAPVRKGKKGALKGEASGNIKALIAQHAAANGVPLRLADAIVRIESRYNPHVTNHGAMGLMQIKTQTARGVGFSGSPGDLLNADTNLRYGMKYLAQVYNMSGGNVCATVMRYQTGMAATHLSAANRAYCAKAKLIMG